MAEYRVLIDWDGDGDYSSTLEDVTDYVMEAEWRLGMRQADQLMADEQSLSLTLRNEGRVFSPENTGGALYGSLLPQRKAEIISVHGGGTTVHWRGWVDAPAPTYGVRGELRATITGAGPKRYIQEIDVHLPLMESVKADEIIRQVFGYVVWPVTTEDAWLAGVPGHSEAGVTTYAVASVASLDFETGQHTFDYVDTLDGVSGWAAIEQAVMAERGRFFFNRAGDARFWDRHYLLMRDTVAGTITRFHGFDYAYGADIINQVRVISWPRTISAGTVTLWALEEALTLRPEEEKSVTASYTEEDSDTQVAAVDVIRPNASDGSLTADAGVSLVSFTEAAQSATLDFRNDNSVEADVTGISIRGRKLTSHRQQESVQRDDDSYLAYGLREMKIDAGLLDDARVADDIAAYELARRKTAQGVVHSFTLMRRVADETDELSRTLTIGDRLRLTEAQTGFDGDVLVVGEQHRLRDGLQVHEATLSCEPATRNQFWRAGVAGYSEAGETTIAAY